MSTPKLGLVAAANNIEQGVIDTFEKNARAVLEKDDMLYVSKGETFGPYNKSRYINDGLRQLIKEQCDIIVQTDIDVAFTKALLEETRSKTASGIHFWTPFFKDGVLRVTAKGSWNALTSEDWLRIGGYNERFFGWGQEDDELHGRCQKFGLNLVVGLNNPIHNPHAPRDNWSRNKSYDRTHDISREISLAENFVNYLGDSLRTDKGITLHLTSRCERKCRHCCLQDFMAIDPTYDISEAEIDRFIEAVERNPYEVDHVILCGGEPLLCPNLHYAIRRTNECKKIRSVWLFSGLVEGFDYRSLPEVRGPVRFSIYGVNQQLIQEALDQGVRPEFMDKRFHTVLPDRLYPEAIPGQCYNPEIFIYKDRVYACPMVAQNLVRHGIAEYDSPLYSEPLTDRLFDRLRGWKTGAMITCSGCAGNLNFQKIAGLYSNENDILPTQTES